MRVQCVDNNATMHPFNPAAPIFFHFYVTGDLHGQQHQKAKAERQW